MAAKKPFANYSGSVQEMASGDTVPVANGGTGLTSPGTSGNVLTSNGTDWVSSAPAGGREVLTAARTYYVATTGSDSNDGLAVGTPFLTIQKAVDVVAALDLSIYQVTIQVADGTYTSGCVISSSWIGGSVVLQGNTGTPSNVLVSTGATTCVSVILGGSLTVQGFKFTNSALYHLQADRGGSISFGSVDFGTGSTHLRASDGGKITATGAYTISGSAAYHISTSNGTARITGITVTISGTPAFSLAYAASGYCSAVYAHGCTFSGGATGVRYSVTMNGVLFVGGAGTTYLPGSLAGTTATGGQYA